MNVKVYRLKRHINPALLHSTTIDAIIQLEFVESLTMIEMMSILVGYSCLPHSPIFISLTIHYLLQKFKKMGIPKAERGMYLGYEIGRRGMEMYYAHHREHGRHLATAYNMTSL